MESYFLIMFPFLLVGIFALPVQFEKPFDTNNVGKPAAPAKTYIVDLDLAPSERWKNLIEGYDLTYLKQGLNQIIDAVVPSPELTNVIQRILGDLDKFIPEPYADEMRGLSDSSGIPLGQIVLINLIYDFTAYASNSSSKACTSIVTRNNLGQIIQGRNLDYELSPSVLRNITIQVDFQQNGKTAYMGTTYVGYIGLITGYRPGAFSISGDERYSGNIWFNILAALEGSHFTFFTERRILQESSDYVSALNQVTNTPTIAPVYFILGGLKGNEGAIIVKNSKTTEAVIRLGENFTHPWFIVETNYDPWNKPPKSDDRRDAAVASLVKIGEKSMNRTELYKVLSTPPVCNGQTTYTTIMSAAQSYYHTMVRYDAPALK
ncbi:N-acylethanolamine-hydrolyzing acid amidase-like [Clavelina lepadiformis]|uniref:N-acylethanolamine-hydrolyzing acid amidase-like n=1 Tax=Clavelina lepadiformis TaxID=159417 RepID=UPI004041AE70